MNTALTHPASLAQTGLFRVRSMTALRKMAISCAALVLTVAISLVAIPVRSAYAYGPIDVDRTGSLTVIYRDGDAAVAGVPIELRRVADVSAGGVFTFTDTYADYGVSLDIEDAAGWRAAAQTLAGYVDRDDIPADATAVTDASGVVTFSSLKPGLYLDTSAPYEQDGIRYTQEPALVMVPQLDEYDQWDYDAEVVLKFTEEQLPPAPVGEDFKVVKLWLSDEGAGRPDSVTVQLLRDGEVFDTQVLSDENGWVYVWEDLDSSYTWTVVEVDVPDGYTTVVHREGDTFVIENTLEPGDPSDPDDPDKPEDPDDPEDPDEPEEPEEPEEPGEPEEPDDPGDPGEPEEPGDPGEPEEPGDPGKPWEPTDFLPQTGISHWVIAPIALTGMILFAIGWYRNKRDAASEK